MTKICGICLAILLAVSSLSAPVYTVTPGEDGVEEFLGVLEDAPMLYLGDQCREVTPAGLYEKTGCRLFKFQLSCASYLYYEDAVYPLGRWFGGNGLDSAAAADLNGDGVEEVYFTYSWGSGLHNTHVGCFDPASRTVTLSDYRAGVTLLVTDSGAVWFAQGADNVLRGTQPAGTLRWEDGALILEDIS